ncbi:MAG: SH3 domain-containing protein, partial [Chloroflexi bacterium]|nr:SH3 domain-containing protein [Chloroflexota bacterium]
PIGVINTGALNLRSGPGREYSSLGALAGGEETFIIGRNLDASWWLLDTRLGPGWASAVFVIARGDISTVPVVQPGEAVAPSPGQQGGEAPVPEIGEPTAVVSTGALNVRSGPSSAFPSIGVVYGTETMPIVGQSPDRGWWKVDTRYGMGWVSKAHIIVDGDTTFVPVVSQ